MNYPDLFLKKHEDKRLRKGHLWIFSNEVDIVRSPLETFTAGDLVTVKDSENRSLGTAYVNPNTLICARLLSRKNLVINNSFFHTRLQQALSLRERLFDKPYYRLVFAESDGLPGLVVDRFDRLLSVQITTAGMERLRDMIFESLTALLQPAAIVCKNQNPLRELENLPIQDNLVLGLLPEELVIEENSCRFIVDILNGQKTGWFFDHRSSRANLMKWVDNRRVLDLFSYSGAWGIQAAAAGARHVTCVDSSSSALALAEQNAELNNLSQRVNVVRSDVFEFLKQAREQQLHYDIIVLDPPALIKRKKDFNNGLEAYRRLNRLALQVLSDNGLLVSASCSQHLSRENLHELLRANARHVDRHLVFIESGSQGLDHPIHPALPETHYLKSYFCFVARSL